MNWIKNLLKKWKVQIAVVAGVVVVTTTWGTCNYQLPVAEEAATTPENAVPASTETTGTTTTAEGTTGTTTGTEATDTTTTATTTTEGTTETTGTTSAETE